MGGKTNNVFKLGIGMAISIFFLYLAFRQVELHNLLEVLRNSHGTFLMFAVFVLFTSHWFRAVRHRYLLESVKRIENGSLFSALMIGYLANTVLPAHLGEFLRAYVIGKKERISASSTFATIVVERVLDVLSLIIIMGLVFVVYPFPEMFKLSVYLTFAFATGIVGFLALLKFKPELSFRFMKIATRLFPNGIADKILQLLESFREGLVALKDRKSYFIVFVLSIVIWAIYAGVFAIGFYAFDFIELYSIPISASLVVLVITTISIVVPSSPGYVGTYHWLCMIALSLFAVPESHALGYAIVIHAINMIPVALVGVAFALKEGVTFSKIRKQIGLREVAITD